MKRRQSKPPAVNRRNLISSPFEDKPPSQRHWFRRIVDILLEKAAWVIASLVIVAATPLVLRFIGRETKPLKVSPVAIDTVQEQIAPKPRRLAASSPHPQSGGHRSKDPLTLDTTDSHAISRTPPPITRYMALRFVEVRQHPLEFKLYGDSLVCDAALEPMDSLAGGWPGTNTSTPTASIAIYSPDAYNSQLLDVFTVHGHWITEQQNRALFLLPKDRIMKRNLRFRLRVLVPDGDRHVRAIGKYTNKKDATSWYVRLEADKEGRILRRDWVWHFPHVP